MTAPTAPGGSAGAGPDGTVVWFTGLPSSGKSTLAGEVRSELRARGVAVAVLDGDAVRAALHPAPGYDPAARDDFYRTLADLAVLLAAQGLVVLVPATAHLARYRAYARAGAPRFVEVWVRTTADECARRDAKGLYAAASGGAAPGLPGAGVAYEEPLDPEVVARDGAGPAAVRAVLSAIAGRDGPP